MKAKRLKYRGTRVSPKNARLIRPSCVRLCAYIGWVARTEDELRPPVSVETGMRGRRRIRTAEYWREYYRRKQREWRAVHLYSVSRKAVMRVFDECGKVTPPHRPDLNRLTSEKVKKSRWLRDLMRLRRTELAAEVERSRRLYIELRQRQGLAWFPP